VVGVYHNDVVLNKVWGVFRRGGHAVGG
jgi:hypothetical protein